MAFGKGHKKTGGREAGTPNKISGEMREMLKVIVENEMKSVPKLLEKLKPKDRLEIIVKLLPYLLPKEKEPDILPDRLIPPVIHVMLPDDEDIET
jgi:hypothetical protein